MHKSSHYIVMGTLNCTTTTINDTTNFKLLQNKIVSVSSTKIHTSHKSNTYRLSSLVTVTGLHFLSGQVTWGCCILLMSDDCGHTSSLHQTSAKSLSQGWSLNVPHPPYSQRKVDTLLYCTQPPEMLDYFTSLNLYLFGGIGHGSSQPVN